jgi:capsular exopolysaccharide synthesis family protein
LEALRSTLLSSVKNYINTLELQLSRARGNEAALAGRLNTVPEAEKQGLDIKRQQELKSNLYVYLLNKREEVSLQMAISEANVRLVEDPRGSNVPIDPRKNTILLLGLLLGLALPAAILYLRHLLDVTINGRRDLELATSIPIVGDIPRWEGATVGNRLISQAEADAPIVESFRVLRYALNFMRHSAKVFIVTSATPGQGKSFISSNLSYILGVTGKRVLLIDGDIRKRTMTGELGNSKGLTGLLIEEGEIDLDGAILRNAVGNRVDFLPAGKIPPNPSELLMSDRLDEIIDAVRARYDYIVIDATPTLSVSDADILNRVADITLFVLRVGVQHRDFLPELENMYRAKKFRNLCAVINDANSKRGYGNYGYGYGYSYGYGDGKKSRKRIPFFRR